MARKSKKEKRRLEQEYGQDYGYQSPAPQAFYAPIPGLIPVAPPSRQPIQLAPIVQPIALAPYSLEQKQQAAQTVDDDDDYDF